MAMVVQHLDWQRLKDFLDLKVEHYNRPAFIANDPIVIPHQFKEKQDIEIAAFFAAILAWGQRKTIINKCNELFLRMGGKPFEFIKHHKPSDLKALLGFKHRTFNDTDLLYFVAFLKQHYHNFDSLESAFLLGNDIHPHYMDGMTVVDRQAVSSSPCYSSDFSSFSITKALNNFRAYFFSLEDFPKRTIKHISSPVQKSTCKRLNMFLRWMVRQDTAGVDFGIWRSIPMSALVCPCDVHVDRIARQLGLIERKQTDWQTAIELTEKLRTFDPHDPVKYDFALFGIGVEEKFLNRQQL